MVGKVPKHLCLYISCFAINITKLTTLLPKSLQINTLFSHSTSFMLSLLSHHFHNRLTNLQRRKQWTKSLVSVLQKVHRGSSLFFHSYKSRLKTNLFKSSRYWKSRSFVNGNCYVKSMLRFEYDRWVLQCTVHIFRLLLYATQVSIILPGWLKLLLNAL